VVNGTVSGDTLRYYPFGEEQVTTPNNRDKFATYFRDSSTGLDYALNRYYGNSMGRFLTPDPYRAGPHGFRPENPASWNPYVYVVNDPVNYFDPKGLDYEIPPGGTFDPADPRNVAPGDGMMTVTAGGGFGAILRSGNFGTGPDGRGTNQRRKDPHPEGFGDGPEPAPPGPIPELDLAARARELFDKCVKDAEARFNQRTNSLFSAENYAASILGKIAQDLLVHVMSRGLHRFVTYVSLFKGASLRTQADLNLSLTAFKDYGFDLLNCAQQNPLGFHY
ncbi:MAG: RHS repeat-associated core domain-containing protein, partial [candidate division Zixibacteria bacterium]|nr:RHS repeat-associated core domain-containing protein [candidate division Zixibacteria bacterium]